MGLLTPDYYQGLLDKSPTPAQVPRAQPVGSATPQQPAQTAPDTSPVLGQEQKSIIDTGNNIAKSVSPILGAAEWFVGNPIEAVKKIGSSFAQTTSLLAQATTEFFHGKGDLPNEVWDKMSASEKKTQLVTSAEHAGLNFLVGMPKAIVKTAINLPHSIYRQIKDPLTGTDPDTGRLSIPWVGALVDRLSGNALKSISPIKLGANRVDIGSLPKDTEFEIPTYAQTSIDNKRNGIGFMQNAFNVLASVVGDVSMVADAGLEVNDMVSGPKGRMDFGGVLPETASKEASTALAKGRAELEAKVAANLKSVPKDSPHTYQGVSPQFAKGYGGNASNTFIKVSPAGLDGSVKVSVIRTNRFGAIEPGNFSGETELASITSGPGAMESTKPSNPSDVVPFENKAKPSPVQDQLTELKTIRNELSATKQDFVQGYLQSEKGAQLLASREVAASNPLEVNRGVVQGVKNSSYYKTEGSVHDMMGSGTLMVKNGRTVLALPDEVQSFVQRGYSKGIEIDSLAKEQGFSDGNAYIEAQMELAGQPRMTAPETAAHNALMQTEPAYKDLVAKLEETKSQINSLYEQETSKTESAAGAASKEAEGNAQGGVSDALKTKIKESPHQTLQDRPVTVQEIDHLKAIMEANKMAPSLADSVVKLVTGKDSIGEMTHAEYVKASQALAAFSGDARYYGRDAQMPNPVTYNMTPAAPMAKAIEAKTGVPFFSKVVNPLETARAAAEKLWRSADSELQTNLESVGADKIDPKTSRLVTAYMDGDKAAITENANLSPAQKTDLLAGVKVYTEWYDKWGQKLGIDRKYFIDNYSPNIEALGGIFNIEKGGEAPGTMEAFATKKRGGAMNPSLDNPRAQAQIYARALSRAKFYDPALKTASEAIDAAPKNFCDPMKGYVDEHMGRSDKVDAYINRAGKHLGEIFPSINVPDDVARQMMNLWMDSTYAGALGLRPEAALRIPVTHGILQYARLGSRFLGDAISEVVRNPKIAYQELESRGLIVQRGVPYGADLARETSTGQGLVNGYRKAAQATLSGLGMADAGARMSTFSQGKLLWNDALGRVESGQMTWKQAENLLDMDAFHPLDRNIIREKIAAGDTPGAFEHYIRSIVDEVNFSYNRATSAPMTYGSKGKIGFQFAHYPIRYATTVSNWIRTGQWDKIIRVISASTLAKRSVKESTGIDIGDWVAPVGHLTLSPAVQGLSNLFDLVGGYRDGDQKKINDSWKQITNAVSGLAPPTPWTGVAAIHLKNFMTSVARSEKDGLAAQGQFGVYSAAGYLKYTTDFAGILPHLFGLKTEKDIQSLDLIQRERNAVTDQSSARQQIDELMNGTPDDVAKAMKLMQEWHIGPSANWKKREVVPETQSLFQTLPPTSKPMFAPQVFSK